MVTMIICIVLLLVGYVLYGKFTEGAFGPDPERKTPAYTKFDGWTTSQCQPGKSI